MDPFSIQSYRNITNKRKTDKDSSDTCYSWKRGKLVLVEALI